MTRENKLALVVGFGLILIVGILISDHLSAVSRQEVAQLGVVDPLSAGGAQAAARLVEYQPTIARTNAQKSESNDLAAARSAQNDDANRIIDQSRQTSQDRPRADAGGREVDLNNGSQQGSPLHLTGLDTATQLQTVSLTDTTTESPATAAITFHDVRDGESLSTICRNFYGTSRLVEKLAAYNNITNPNLVQAGTRLKLPAVLDSHARKSAGNQGAATQKKQVEQPLQSMPRTYTIKRGDTLSELAAKLLGSSKHWVALQKANPKEIPDPDHLIEGVTIRIPSLSDV